MQKRAREADQRDIVLYIPDRLLAYDRATGRGVTLSYDFALNGQSTKGLPHATAGQHLRQDAAAGLCRSRAGRVSGHGGDGARAFARGDLFEVVPGQLFAEPCERSPAEVFQRLCRSTRRPMAC